MFTYFLTAARDALGKIKSEDDLLTHVEKNKPQIGGRFSRERIDYLGQIFLGNELRSAPTGDTLTNGSALYQLDHDLAIFIGRADQGELENASARWADEAWKGTEINPFDLAGFLLEISELSKVAVSQGNEIYFVSVSE
jgi:hypothetical protein